MEKTSEYIQIPKIEYGNRFLDKEQWRNYIEACILFIDNGGVREERKNWCMYYCKKLHQNLDDAQSGALVEEICAEYLNDQDRIARQVAEYLKKFLVGKLLIDDLQKNIPAKYEIDETDLSLHEVAEERQMTLRSRIDHLVGNYIQRQYTGRKSEST